MPEKKHFLINTTSPRQAESIPLPILKTLWLLNTRTPLPGAGAGPGPALAGTGTKRLSCSGNTLIRSQRSQDDNAAVSRPSQTPHLPHC